MGRWDITCSSIMKTKFCLMAVITAFSLIVMTSCTTSEVIIEAEVQAAQRQCPQDLGNGLTLTKVENDARYVIYYYNADETLYSFSQSMVTDAQKEQIISTLQAQAATRSEVQRFVKALQDANKGLIYHYFTSSTNMDIVVEARELRY